MSKFEQIVRKYGPRMAQDLSINLTQVAGIFGNLGGETGGFRLLQEQKPLVKGSRGGYGWMQWTGPRRRKYEAWAKANRLNVADNETNYKYLIKETLTDEVASLRALRKCTTVDQATQTFCLKNLRPGIPHMQGRLSWGRKAEKILNSKLTTNEQTGIVAASSIGTTATAVYNYPDMWMWIVGGVILAVIVGFGLYKWLKS